MRNWLDARAEATFAVTEKDTLPAGLYGISFSPLEDPPETVSDWEAIDGLFGVDEPSYPTQYGLRLTSGCVVFEPDDRIWVVHPSNGFQGVKVTFPKGRWDDESISLLTNAVKETYEESGLWVKPVDYLCDVVRTRTVTRYYMAERITGTPVNMGWESQAVSLVPLSRLERVLNRPNDRKVLPYLFDWMRSHGAMDVPVSPADV